jgi:hypothetical protein
MTCPLPIPWHSNCHHPALLTCCAYNEKAGVMTLALSWHWALLISWLLVYLLPGRPTGSIPVSTLLRWWMLLHGQHADHPVLQCSVPGNHDPMGAPALTTDSLSSGPAVAFVASSIRACSSSIFLLLLRRRSFTFQSLIPMTNT